MNIVTGNPSSEKPASYTRFVLPFKYSGKIKVSDSSSFGYEKIDKQEFDARKSYFTKETSKVLFEKAKYYQLKKGSLKRQVNSEKSQPQTEINVHENDFLTFEYLNTDITLKLPQVVLFEAESASTDSLLKTGFLILELFFEKGTDFETLLEVNELFRYKTKPFKDHKNQVTEAFWEKLKEYDIANYQDKFSKNHQEKYCHWELFLMLLYEDLKINFEKKENSEYFWDIYADSRTFVWSCAVTKNGAKGLRNSFYPESSDEKWQAQNYGHWIKLLNVDKPRWDSERENKIDFDSKKVHLSTHYEREWANEKTYKRWEESGSFYGFSYHSGVALIPTETDPPLWKHFGQMYFDMLLLLLYTRVTVFRFSNELTKISIKATKNENIEANVLDWRKSFEGLRWEFTLFTNLYQFPLISNQQQMLEMYAIAREALDIQELYSEVKEEIHNNQEYILQQIQQNQSTSSLTLSEQSTLMTKNSLRLTRLATVGLVIGMAVTMLGTDISKWLGSLVSKYLTPDFFQFEGGFSVDWFLIIIYIPIFWLLLVGIVKLWEKFFGEKNEILPKN